MTDVTVTNISSPHFTIGHLGNPREMAVRLEYTQDGSSYVAQVLVGLSADTTGSQGLAEEAALEVMIALTEALRLRMQPDLQGRGS